MNTKQIWKAGHIFALVASLLVLPTAAAAQDGTITGSVVDQETGTPLPGASVLLVGENIGAATNAEGRCTIESVNPGEYTLRASVVGYEIERREVTVPAGDTVMVDFALSVSAIQLDELVTCGAWPVPRLTVGMASTQMRYFQQATTGGEESTARR